MTENKTVAYIKKDENLDTERSIICYASTGTTDRHGEMVLPTAWTEEGLADYRKNPVILLNHSYGGTFLPVGKSLWQKVDSNGLKFKIQFADTELGRELYYLYSNGYMSSFSVGFSPVKIYDNEQTMKYKDKSGKIPHTVYEECKLFELSAVNIPANPDANIIRTFKGLFDQQDKGMIHTKEVNDFIEVVKQSKEYIELTEPTESKAKKIGFIDLENKCSDCEEHEEPVAEIEEKATKPCKQEGGECMEDCEEYGTCEDEMKKNFNPEEVINEDTVEDKGISDDTEAGLPDILDNGDGEIDELVEEKEVNLDEIETKNEEIIENNVEDKTIRIDVSQLKEIIDELKSYIDENIEEKLKFSTENADKVNMEEKLETVVETVVETKEFIELKESEKVFEIEEKTIPLDISPEEIKSMMKSAILNTVSSSKSVDKLVEERIRRMKGIIDFEDE